MADDPNKIKEVTEATKQATAATKEHAAATKELADNQSILSQLQESIRNKIKGFSDYINDSKKSVDSAAESLEDYEENYNSLITNLGNDANIKKNIATFGMLSSTMMQLADTANGVKTGMSGFASTEISKPLDTYNSQLQSLINVTKVGAGGLSKLKDIGGSMGVKFTGAETLDQVAAIVSKTAQAFTESADKAAAFEKGIIATSAASGEMNKVFDGTNNKFFNMASASENLNEMMTSTEKTTGTNRDIVDQYASKLAMIPGTLSSVVNSLDKGGKSTSMLSAAFLLAEGSGKDMSAVVDDLNVAFKTYGLTGEKALNFTAKISQASEQTTAPLALVKDYMHKTAEEFKYFGDQSSGSAEVFNKLYSGFKNAGVSAESAAGMVEKVTHQIGEMNVAQKAFVSGQAGGPGGLMGAFKIDKMLNEGKITEVFDMVRKTMQKQMGKIVTLEEAGTSEQMAAKYQKQMLMLKSGPLGKFAGSDAEAQKMIAGFASGTIPKELSKDASQDFMNRGSQRASERITAISQAKAAAESLQISGGINAKNMIVETFSLKGAMEINPNGEQARRLNATNKMAMDHGVRSAEDMGNQKLKLSGKAGVAQAEKRNIKNIVGSTIDMGQGVKAGIDSTKVFAANVGKMFENMASFELPSAEKKLGATAEVSASTSIKSQAENKKDSRSQQISKENKDMTVNINTLCVECHKKVRSDSVHTGHNIVADKK